MTKAQVRILDAALFQQWWWEQCDILDRFMIRELDYFGQCEFEFGEPLFTEVGGHYV